MLVHIKQREVHDGSGETMTVQEIIDRVLFMAEECGAEHTPATVLGYINDGLDDLAPAAKMLDSLTIALNIVNGKATIIIQDGVPLDVAHEFLNVYFTPTGGERQLLRRLPMADWVSCGWKLTANVLTLQKLPSDSGTADVEFYGKMAHVSDLDDVPPLPEQYHNLLVLYCCAKIQEREPLLETRRDFISEYAYNKQLFAIQRTWDMEPQHRWLIRQDKAFGFAGSSKRKGGV